MNVTNLYRGAYTINDSRYCIVKVTAKGDLRDVWYNKYKDEYFVCYNDEYKLKRVINIFYKFFNDQCFIDTEYNDIGIIVTDSLFKCPLNWKEYLEDSRRRPR